MKAFIFTVDSIFSLIVAVAAISILLFSIYSPSYAYQAPTAEVDSIAQALLQTTMGQAAQTVKWAYYATSSFQSGKWAWPQYGYNGTVSSATPGQGPGAGTVLWSYSDQTALFPNIAVGDGLVVFMTKYSRVTSLAIPFYSGWNITALNATTGRLVFSYGENQGAAGGAAYFEGGPVIYQHKIYMVNNTGAVFAFNETQSGSWAWHTAALAGGVSILRSPMIGIEDGYLVDNSEIINPLTGAVVSYLQSNTMTAYSNGEFISSGAGASGTLNLFGNALYSGQQISLWSNTFTINGVPQPIATGGNMVVVGGGSILQAAGINGGTLWTKTPIDTIAGGAAIYNNAVYFQTQNALYGYTNTGNWLFGYTLPFANIYNYTPSVTPRVLYTVDNGATLQAFTTGTGKFLWNLTTLATFGPTTSCGAGCADSSNVPPTERIGDVPIAYGNAYFAGGNTIYAVGTCKSSPQTSVLQALATFYLNGFGECANLILNGTYPSNNIGIFINNTYGPSEKLATFNALANSAISLNANILPAAGACSYTLSAWAYDANIPSSGEMGGVVGLGRPSSGGGTLEIEYNDNTLRFDDSNSIGANMANVVGSYRGKWMYTALVLNNGVATGYLNNNAIWTNSINVGCLGFGYGQIGKWDGYFNGTIADVQIYSNALNLNQISTLYQGGIAAPPVGPSANVVGWWPLEGDTNDYSNYHYAYPTAINYTTRNFVPISLTNTYQASRATVPMILNNDGVLTSYNVGVALWR